MFVGYRILRKAIRLWLTTRWCSSTLPVPSSTDNPTGMCMYSLRYHETILTPSSLVVQIIGSLIFERILVYGEVLGFRLVRIIQ